MLMFVHCFFSTFDRFYFSKALIFKIYAIRMAECDLGSEKLIWKHCIDLIRNGISRLKGNKEDCMKLPAITTLFLARTFAIITNPMDEMYEKLIDFLCANSFLQIFRVLEFDRLFNSSHSIDQHKHQVNFCWSSNPTPAPLICNL